ncbi:polysaccharide biosynthesis tyrosine autokinase [Siminovitchia acidinfaciens]|uniref:non-specific protein-tyrosine kinase n=1 Tax=Siminovitchia acidinfaciens TaxID=2321395 RepID=A0A429XZH0_9BACI|nr:CpsD/CapB family tyrosine-protein kinase [Siminovitchia acidinfaciens]RST74194.1 polysaccharide biosynthesis tyrosine autokinase [Siminovitchia acidinfaciens]
MARSKKKKALQTIRRKLITKLNPKSPISEQYRTIRTNIQFSSVDEEIRSIMVTSSGPGEGKSTTAANLAIVFAQQGKRVLLIDGDLRKPTVHYTFGLTNSFGLSNVLTHQMEISEVINVTNEELLSVMTSGPIPPNPAELLSSRTMANFIQEAQSQFDLIIFDTPPVLAVTDAQLLSNHCDGTVLVISSGKTEVEAALKTKESLEAAKAKLLGVILNNKKMKKNDNYYYYYQA